MLKRIVFAAAASLLIVSAVAATAADIQELAKEAEAKAATGQHLEAVETLRRATNLLMSRGPLTLRRVQFISGAPKGFGIYQPRPNNVFNPGEPLIVYAEPVGVGWNTADGVNRSVIVTDFEIRTPEGTVLGAQKEFGRFEFVSREQNHEIMTHLTITLSGAPRGRYVFAATYRDQVNGKTATLELPFEIK